MRFAVFGIDCNKKGLAHEENGRTHAIIENARAKAAIRIERSKLYAKLERAGRELQIGLNMAQREVIMNQQID